MESGWGPTDPAERVEIEVLDLLSRKWHPVVLLALEAEEPAGFTDLSEAIPDVSAKVLTDALEDLCEADLVERRVLSESPLRVEYERTAAGRDLEDVFEALETWGHRHLQRGSPTVVVADGDPRLTEMYAQWLSGHYDVVRVHDGDALRDVLAEEPEVLLAAAELPRADPAAVVDAAPESCRTIVLLGEPPGLWLLEVDCDDVLRKPIVRDAARDAVETQLGRRGESAAERDRAALAAKLSLLEESLPRETLEASLPVSELRLRLDEPGEPAGE